jgi:predicted TPR repeat methyltransferase
MNRRTKIEQQQSARLCPNCLAGDAIRDDEQLWPPGWRCPSCGYAIVVRAEIPYLAPERDGQDAGFDPVAFEPLARIEAQHFWFQIRNDLIAWLLRRYASDARQILEIGCGTGFALHAIRAACPNANIAGIELHSEGLSLARTRHGAAVELIQAEAHQLYLRNALDVVCALDVFEHIEDDELVLGEIGAALCESGGRDREKSKGGRLQGALFRFICESPAARHDSEPDDEPNRAATP